EMVLYLRGDKDSQSQNERVRELVRQLQRLIAVGICQMEDETNADRFKNAFGPQLYGVFKSVYTGFATSVYTEWLSRIIRAGANCDTGFCDDLAEAFRYIHRHDLLDHRRCLAQAYLELTRPENYQPVHPKQADAFLRWYHEPINTQSV